MSDLKPISKLALWQAGLIGLGLILCLYKFISGTIAAEHIRKNGERILIELRPADPRALFLGDYMALNYDQKALPPFVNTFERHKQTPHKGLAVIRLDGGGVVSFVRLASEDETLKNDERLIRYSHTRWRYTYGGERYYFQSGTAERYQDADYGEFRLMPDGRVLLSGLADENKQTILIAGNRPKRAAQ